jgi:hypothetical protein
MNSIRPGLVSDPNHTMQKNRLEGNQASQALQKIPTIASYRVRNTGMSVVLSQSKMSWTGRKRTKDKI